MTIHSFVIDIIQRFASIVVIKGRITVFYKMLNVSETFNILKTKNITTNEFD